MKVFKYLAPDRIAMLENKNIRFTSAKYLTIQLNHYHSSRTKPSQQDVLLTQKLKEGGKAVGLQLTDHLIITEEGYLSFADEGLLYPL